MASRLHAGTHSPRRKGRYQPMSEINVTPFVDVMLVLLIVFMVTAPLLTVGVPVDLPESQAQSIADPDWFLKMRLGCGDQVRVCIYSNYCEALDTRHKQVTCELWDREDKDAPGVTLSSDGKRRLLPPPWEPPAE